MQSAVPLSLCMIVRDSARTLGACLQSIHPWVDEIIVVDTGSVDDTCAIAASMGATLYHFPWVDDFAVARNESLRFAKGKWIFWMDSDDTISPENGARLRDIACAVHSDKILGFVMQVHCPGVDRSTDVTVVDHIKMIRNLPEIQFEGRIHEQILPSIRRLDGEIGWTDIFVTHSGSDTSVAGRKRKLDRDLRLLKLDLADRPDHPFVLFNFGMTFNDMGQHAEAVYWLRRSLAFSLPQESHVRKCYAILIQSLAEVGAVSQAILTVEQSLKLFPDDPELWFRKGLLSQNSGQFDEAIHAYSMALRGERERRFTSRDPGINDYKARHNLAISYSAVGKHDLAERQWRLVIAGRPDHREAWSGLRRELLSQRKNASFEIDAANLRMMTSMAPESACWDAILLLSSQNIEEAKSRLQRFSQDDRLFDLDAAQLYCQLLFEDGAFAEVTQVLRRLLQETPDDAASHHNLGIAFSKLGELDKAREHLQRSLEIRPNNQATRDVLQGLSHH